MAGVVVFGLTIVVAFLLSGSCASFSGGNIYPRIGLLRGPSYALSTLSYYAFILAGALGVGIAIGLQNVVADFPSGLVLLLGALHPRGAASHPAC